ncbi:HNH endonuclease [Streptomyces phage Pablito]|uniref:HNH endonuclease n=1 Tax=Streptomyces phage Pablito TaxID=2894593 RepID=A0AAE8YJN0_9CAUD|nr:HNH endonuclease [Streptomyces phage Pablito]UFD97940.1 putative HNH endonuclease [Streptomyces phage Pablito]
MPNWEGSDRRSRLPKDWSKIRLRVLRRDGGQCTALTEAGARCDSSASDVDHIVAGDDHSLGNLRSLCSYHHKIKSGQEGAAAYNAKRRAIAKRFQRSEQHPGLL